MNLESLGSVQAIEGRIQQLETMLNRLDATPAGPARTGGEADSSFQQILRNRQAVDTQGLGPTQAVNEAALQPIIQQLSSAEGLDPKLVNSVIRQESGFNPQAVSKSGALGLMQLMPQTAQAMGVQSPLDPSQNIAGGVKYLKQLVQQYHGNVPMALAAYNAGSGAVNRYGGVPPYAETQNYVKSIMANYQKNAS